MSMYSRLAASAGRARRASAVIEAAAATFDVRPAEITAHRRDDVAVIAARRLVAYLLVEECGFPPLAAARALDRHHSTIMYHVGKAREDLRLDPDAGVALDEIKRRLAAAASRAVPVPPVRAAIVEAQSAALAGKPRACA